MLLGGDEHGFQIGSESHVWRICIWSNYQSWRFNILKNSKHDHDLDSFIRLYSHNEPLDFEEFGQLQFSVIGNPIRVITQLQINYTALHCTSYTILYYTTLYYTNYIILHYNYNYTNYTTLQLQLHDILLQLQLQLHYTTLYPTIMIR